MRGIEKSSRMQDKIINRMDGHRMEEAPRYELPQRSWTPERWQHRMAKPEAPKPLDLTNFAKTFNNK